MAKIGDVFNIKGVTLVEVLVSISLLATVLLLASFVHLFAQKQMNSQTKEIQVQAEERLAIKQITKEINKAETVEVTNHNELIINGLDIYRLEGTILKRNNQPYVTNIKEFIVSKTGNQVKLKIGNLPETTIFLRV